MSENISHKKRTILIAALVIFFFAGLYFTYLSRGASVTLIPTIFSYLGIVLVFIELATGNIAFKSIFDSSQIKIGRSGKLGLLFILFGGFLNNIVAG